MSQDNSRKTEKATPKKLRDARKKGQVIRSKEIVSMAVILCVALYFWLTWSWQLEHLKEIVLAPAALYDMEFRAAFLTLVNLIVTKAILYLVLPILALVIISVVLANIVQFGFNLSPEPVAPKFTKINPVSGFKRIFSAKHTIETLFAAIKLIVIVVLLYWIIRESFKELVHDISICDLNCLMQLLQSLVFKLVVSLVPVLIILAVIDFLFQKAQYLKEQRMTKEEVKKERKDNQGDPEIKSQQRKLRRSLAKSDLKEKVANARVIITDGRGTAIVLKYNEDKMPLPIILAISKDNMTKTVLGVARREDTTVIRAPKLAKTLISDGTIDQYIPSSSVEAMGEVMRKLKGLEAEKKV